jgi:hypothetical protein
MGCGVRQHAPALQGGQVMLAQGRHLPHHRGPHRLKGIGTCRSTAASSSPVCSPRRC